MILRLFFIHLGLHASSRMV